MQLLNFKNYENSYNYAATIDLHNNHITSHFATQCRSKKQQNIIYKLKLLLEVAPSLSMAVLRK